MEQCETPNMILFILRYVYAKCVCATFDPWLHASTLHYTLCTSKCKRNLCLLFRHSFWIIYYKTLTKHNKQKTGGEEEIPLRNAINKKKEEESQIRVCMDGWLREREDDSR